MRDEIAHQRTLVLGSPAVRARLCPGSQDHGRYLQEVPVILPVLQAFTTEAGYIRSQGRMT